jgi:serine protease Do
MASMLKARLGPLSRLWLIGLAFVLVAGAARAEGPVSVADLAAQLSDAVVNISTKQKITQRNRIQIPNLPQGSLRDLFEDFLKRRQGRQRPNRRISSLGSGFVIDPSGIIVTNNHVIKNADEIVVSFANREKLNATVIGRDPETDVAVLRVKPKKPLTSVKMGNSDTLRVGDWVMAIGNPFGLGGTVTLGIVSARNRRINQGPYDDFIQTDAAINRGNSGGPLFNMKGEVVGINTAIISPTGGSIGIGFAVPTSTAGQVIAQLRKFGTTRRGWIGVRIQNVSTEIAESQDLKKPRGALVADVTEGGPAEAAGLKAPDIIIRFNGKPVKDVRSLQRIVAQTPIEDTVDIVVWRDGAEKKLRIKVGRREEGLKLMARKTPAAAKGPVKTSTVLGLTLSPVTQALRTRYKITGRPQGALVTKVDPDSSAARKRITPGNIITEVDQVPVKSPKEMIKQLDRFGKKGRKSVLLTVLEPSGETRFAAIRLNSKKAN